MVFTKTPMVERIFVALFLMCYSAISITSMPILGHFYRNVLVQNLNGKSFFINILNEGFCVSYTFRFPFYSDARTYMLVIYKELKYLPWNSGSEILINMFREPFHPSSISCLQRISLISTVGLCIYILLPWCRLCKHHLFTYLQQQPQYNVPHPSVRTDDKCTNISIVRRVHWWIYPNMKIYSVSGKRNWLSQVSGPISVSRRHSSFLVCHNVMKY